MIFPNYWQNDTAVPYGYQSGGEVMSMHAMADAVESKGRYGDTELVHMHPWELKGLETLLGVEMTTNPDTGKREGLVFLLPMLAAYLGTMGATALGVTGTTLGVANASLAGALASGVASGATTAAMGGTTEEALVSGAIGVGGSALGSAVGAAGESALQGTLGGAGGEAAGGLGQSGGAVGDAGGGLSGEGLFTGNMQPTDFLPPAEGVVGQTGVTPMDVSTVSGLPEGVHTPGLDPPQPYDALLPEATSLYGGEGGLNDPSLKAIADPATQNSALLNSGEKYAIGSKALDVQGGAVGRALSPLVTSQNAMMLEAGSRYLADEAMYDYDEEEIPEELAGSGYPGSGSKGVTGYKGASGSGYPGGGPMEERKRRSVTAYRR